MIDITPLSNVSSDYLNVFTKNRSLVEGEDDSFASVFSAAMRKANGLFSG